MSQSLLGQDSKELYAILSIALKTFYGFGKPFILFVFSNKILFDKIITYGLFFFDNPNFGALIFRKIKMKRF